jgi:CMP-2-keto-3-deoxyoctulosonic acid synthetase
MKAIALIPARLEASRFPRKLLTLIQGKSVLQRTYESAMNSGLFDDVVVVDDVCISTLTLLFLGLVKI